MTDPTDPPALDRRRLLGAAAVAGLGGPLLAACSEDSGAANSSDTPAPERPASSSPDGGGSQTGQQGGASGPDGLVASSDVPVGGGVVIDKEKVVVTQPAKGTFKAFSAVCTHQGCLVASVAENTITCPCHGSEFSAEDGSVVNGPASAPLQAVAVRVTKGQVVAS